MAFKISKEEALVLLNGLTFVEVHEMDSVTRALFESYKGTLEFIAGRRVTHTISEDIKKLDPDHPETWFLIITSKLTSKGTPFFIQHPRINPNVYISEVAGAFQLPDDYYGDNYIIDITDHSDGHYTLTGVTGNGVRKIDIDPYGNGSYPEPFKNNPLSDFAKGAVSAQGKIFNHFGIKPPPLPIKKEELIQSMDSPVASAKVEQKPKPVKISPTSNSTVAHQKESKITAQRATFLLEKYQKDLEDMQDVMKTGGSRGDSFIFPQLIKALESIAKSQPFNPTVFNSGQGHYNVKSNDPQKVVLELVSEAEKRCKTYLEQPQCDSRLKTQIPSFFKNAGAYVIPDPLGDNYVTKVTPIEGKKGEFRMEGFTSEGSPRSIILKDGMAIPDEGRNVIGPVGEQMEFYSLDIFKHFKLPPPVTKVNKDSFIKSMDRIQKLNFKTYPHTAKSVQALQSALNEGKSHVLKKEIDPHDKSTTFMTVEDAWTAIVKQISVFSFEEKKALREDMSKLSFDDTQSKNLWLKIFSYGLANPSDSPYLYLKDVVENYSPSEPLMSPMLKVQANTPISTDTAKKKGPHKKEQVFKLEQPVVVKNGKLSGTVQQIELVGDGVYKIHALNHLDKPLIFEINYSKSVKGVITGIGNEGFTTSKLIRDNLESVFQQFHDKYPDFPKSPLVQGNVVIPKPEAATPSKSVNPPPAENAAVEKEKQTIFRLKAPFIPIDVQDGANLTEIRIEKEGVYKFFALDKYNELVEFDIDFNTKTQNNRSIPNENSELIIRAVNKDIHTIFEKFHKQFPEFPTSPFKAKANENKPMASDSPLVTNKVQAETIPPLNKQQVFELKEAIVLKQGGLSGSVKKIELMWDGVYQIHASDNQRKYVGFEMDCRNSSETVRNMIINVDPHTVGSTRIIKVITSNIDAVFKAFHDKFPDCPASPIGKASAAPITPPSSSVFAQPIVNNPVINHEFPKSPLPQSPKVQATPVQPSSTNFKNQLIQNKIESANNKPTTCDYTASLIGILADVNKTADTLNYHFGGRNVDGKTYSNASVNIMKHITTALIDEGMDKNKYCEVLNKIKGELKNKMVKTDGVVGFGARDQNTVDFYQRLDKQMDTKLEEVQGLEQGSTKTVTAK